MKITYERLLIGGD
jgi:translation initiation factor 2 gamma subunit (eIF-2gamma)